MIYRKFLLSVVALLIAILPVTAFTPKKEYTMQVNVTQVVDWGAGAQKFADLVAQKTNGVINIKPYWSSSLLAGKQTNWYQAVADGAIDFATESTMNACNVIRPFNLFSLPFFINTYDNVDKIENGKSGARIIAEMEKGGVKFLAWGENGFRQITNSKREIRTPKDVEGLKIRVVGSPIMIDIFKQLGADPINMNWGDAVTAFQQGVVDGQENPKGVLIGNKIWEYHKYMTLWNYLIDPLVFCVNSQVWKSFPPDIQAQIQEAALEAGEWEKALARCYLDGDKSLKIFKEKFKDPRDPENLFVVAPAKGMKITVLTAEEIAAFKEKTKPVYDKWVPTIGEDIYKLALEDMK